MNRLIKGSIKKVSDTLIERGSQYTKNDEACFQVFETVAYITGMSTSDVFYTMLAMKMARLGENINHTDSILDIAGYAILWDAFIEGGKDV